MNKKRRSYGAKEFTFDPEKELSWMDYSGLLDMEVEFVSELGETELSIGDILKLTKGSIIDFLNWFQHSIVILRKEEISGRILYLIYKVISRN